MNTHIDIKSTTALKAGLLEKTGTEYQLVLLSAQNTDAILTLQDIVYNDLPKEQQNFLLKKSKGFFEKHFAEGNIILGVVHDGQLIAQSIIVNPTPVNPKTGMVDMELDVRPEKITVLQGVIVYPDYRGNHLMTVMADAWLAIADEQGRTTALAETTVDNMHSWSIFLKEGLKIDSIGTDPADGVQVYNLRADVQPLIKARLKNAFNKKAAKNTVKCPHTDLETQKELLSKGFKGIKFDPANDTIEFKPARKAHKFHT